MHPQFCSTLLWESQYKGTFIKTIWTETFENIFSTTCNKTWLMGNDLEN